MADFFAANFAHVKTVNTVPAASRIRRAQNKKKAGRNLASFIIILNIFSIVSIKMGLTWKSSFYRISFYSNDLLVLSDTYLSNIFVRHFLVEHFNSNFIFFSQRTKN